MSMSGKRHTFCSFWYGAALSPLEQLCIESFLAHGHHFTLYAYHDVAGVPFGCQILDAGAILPESEVFYYSDEVGLGSVAAFANLFRMKLLHDRGGWWVDTDVYCLGTPIPAGDYVFAVQYDESINNGVLRFPQGHALLSEAIDRLRQLGVPVRWGQGGPELLTELLRKHGLTARALPPGSFYAIRDTGMFFDPSRADEVERLLSSSVFVHFWNQMIRQAGIDKNIPPPVGSYLWRAYRDHGITFPVGAVPYEAAAVQASFIKAIT